MSFFGDIGDAFSNFGQAAGRVFSAPINLVGQATKQLFTDPTKLNIGQLVDLSGGSIIRADARNPIEAATVKAATAGLLAGGANLLGPKVIGDGATLGGSSGLNLNLGGISSSFGTVADRAASVLGSGLEALPGILKSGVAALAAPLILAAQKVPALNFPQIFGGESSPPLQSVIPYFLPGTSQPSGAGPAASSADPARPRPTAAPAPASGSAAGGGAGIPAAGGISLGMILLALGAGVVVFLFAKRMK